MDVRGLVEYMVQNQNFARVINNPLAQFGPVNRPYLGPSLLPEKEVPENAYVEEAIKYRTQLANDGTRYSPVQKKGGILTGSFQVILGDSDIGSEFTGADYDALIRLIEQATGAQGVPGGGVDRPTMLAIANLTMWADATLTLPLREKLELQRWQSIVNAQVIRSGDNNYTETVNYPNPPGHRVAAAGLWSNNNYDPWTDITTGAEYMAGLGYTINRIITSTPIRTKLSNNQQIKLRAGRISVVASVVSGIPGRVTKAELDELLQGDGLPAIELYDLQYRTQNSTGRFLPSNVVVMVATTGRDMSIDLGDLQPLVVQDTLGYTAIGRTAGQSAPGRKTLVTPYENKPPRIEGEAWQTALPVITEPEAIYVITNIA